MNNCFSANDCQNPCNTVGCSTSNSGSNCSLWIIIGVIVLIFFFCFNDNC